MDVARVFTNETCNLNCTFCNARRSAERPPFVRGAAVRERIDAAAASGARELVLTGGEPTLRRDLPALVAHAAGKGARACLETNAALVTPELAAQLRDAGLAVARVHLPAWGARADAITRDRGSFEATRAGLRALSDAGIAVEVAVPVVRANLDVVAEIPRALVADGVAVRAVVLSVPVQGPDASALADLASAARAIERVDAAARAAGVPVRLESNAAVPPCLFPTPARVAHLFALTPGGETRSGHRHLPACGGCTARDRCPGFPVPALVRDGEPAFTPVRDDRTRRRLSVFSTVQDQVERELATHATVDSPRGPIPEAIVRVNFRCNQVCHFCFVSTHLPQAEDAAVERAIRDIGAQGGRLVLSGGEPTLNPKLLDWVRLGRSVGVYEIHLQTNATRMPPEFAQALAEAGVDRSLVSLHGSTAEISDAITGAPGTFAQTVRGIDALCATSISVQLNFVFCGTNYRDYPDYVRMVAARWPRVSLTISFVGPSTDLVPCDGETIPRYADVMPYMVEGSRIALASGLEVTGFESMCGVPMCLVPYDLLPTIENLRQLAPEESNGEFLKTEACRACAINDRCWGIRKRYAALHGTGELVPVARRAEPEAG